MGKLWRRLEFFLRRRRFAREMDEEMRFHLDSRTEDAMAHGAREEEARRAAARRFGSTARIQEQAREVWVIRAVEALGQDLRYAGRVLRKSPGFTIVSVLGLALGIGISTAMFTRVNELWQRRLHSMPQAERYVSVWKSNRSPFRYADYVHLRDNGKALSQLTAMGRRMVILTGLGEPNQIPGQYITPDAFGVFGEQPVSGRGFLANETQAVVLDYSYWQSQFGADPGVIGKTVTVDGAIHTIVGVAPRDYSAYHRASVYLPLTETPARPVRLAGRLRDGASVEQAQAELTALVDGLRQERAEKDERTAVVLVPGGGNPGERETMLKTSSAIMVAAGMILFIAIANTANLLLARAAARRREIGARLSLGASRGRLIRQLLTESVLLAGIAGAAGLLLSSWLTRTLNAFLVTPGGPEPATDWRVLAYGVLITLAAGVAFGLAPAIEASRPDLSGALKSKAGTAQRRDSLWSLRNALVIVPLAVSLTLLASAGAVVQFLQKHYERNSGLLVDKTISMNFRLAAQGYDEKRAAAFHEQLISRLERIPGVRAVAVARDISLAIDDVTSLGLPIHLSGGMETLPDGRPARAARNIVSPNYFWAIGNPVVRGRGFTAQDSAGAAPVAVVNSVMARTFWPDSDAIGKQVRIGDLPHYVQVVGVIRDVWDASPDLVQSPVAYVPLAQGGGFHETVRHQFLIRADGDQQTMNNVTLPAMRAEVRALDSKLVIDSATMREKERERLEPIRTMAILSTSLGSLAMFMAAVGIYGVMAYAVSRRTQEIGVRMALGARKADVLSLVMRRSVLLIAIGVTVGLGGAIALTSVLNNLMVPQGGSLQARYARALDPTSFLVSTAVLGMVAILASYLPARRATKVDPLVALRYE